jgi:hypothetical protein
VTFSSLAQKSSTTAERKTSFRCAPKSSILRTTDDEKQIVEHRKESNHSWYGA